MTKRIEYWAEEGKAPLQTGDWVRTPMHLELGQIYRVSISPEGKEIRLANWMAESRKGFRIPQDGIEKMIVGGEERAVILHYIPVELSLLLRVLDDTRKTIDWYAQRVRPQPPS
ncbi:MAG: hypothetical protein AABW89_05660 [Nanoarchaeota archaeon]